MKKKLKKWDILMIVMAAVILVAMAATVISIVADASRQKALRPSGDYYGKTVLEAMATGRPILTTDAPGCRQTVPEGKNGMLVPVKSVSALVTAMEQLIADPALCAQMGSESRALAEQIYDVRIINQNISKTMRLIP